MAGQLRVDEITNEAGTGSPDFVNGVVLGDWTLSPSGTDIVFSYNGTPVFKITSAGAVVAKDNVTAYGTV
jgi:hypothetical protein